MFRPQTALRVYKCLILNRNNETISSFPRLNVWQLYKLRLRKCRARLTGVKFLIGNDFSNKFVFDNVHKRLIIFCYQAYIQYQRMYYVPIIHSVPSIIFSFDKSSSTENDNTLIFNNSLDSLFLILIGWEFHYICFQ